MSDKSNIIGLGILSGLLFWAFRSNDNRKNPWEFPQEYPDLKTVIFKDEDEEEAIENDWFYYVVDEDEELYQVVIGSKFPLYKKYEGSPKEYFYAEWIKKDEMKEIEV